MGDHSPQHSLFDAIYYNSPIGIAIVNLDYHIQQANPSFCEFTGFSEEELKTKTIFDLAHPDDREKNHTFQSSLKTGVIEEFSMEKRFIRPDGSIVWGMLHARLVNDDTNKPSHFLGQVIDITASKSASEEITEAMLQVNRHASEVSELLKGAQAILEGGDFADVARKIFDGCRAITGAASGYVALLSDDGQENEVLFLEAGGKPCSVNPDLPMPIRGLRAEAYKDGQAVYDNDFMNSQWMKYMPTGHVALDNVMFAPLNIEGKTMGIMGLANKPEDFTDEDAVIATAFGELAAVALKNSRMFTALQASEERYRLQFEESPLPSHSLDEKGNIININAAWEKTLGYSKSEVIGKWFGSFMPENLQTYFTERFSSLRHSGRVIGAKYDLIHKNGEIRHCVIDARVLRNPDGSFKQTFCVLKDKTEVYKMQDELEASEERFRLVTEAIQEGIFDWNVKTGKVFISPIYLQMLGYLPDELPSHIDSFFKLLHPDDKKRITLSLDEFLGSTDESGELEFRMIHKSGDVRWILSRAKVVERDENGQPLRVVGANTDITEKKLAEQEKESLIRFHNEMLKTAAVWIHVIDNNGNIAFWNRAAESLSGYKINDVIGRSEIWNKLYPDTAYRESVFSQAGNLEQADHAIENFETTITSKNEIKRHIAWYVNPLTDSDGMLIGSIWVGADITDKMLAQEEKEKLITQLHQQQKLESIGTLARGVAHEINNPITAILSFSELIRDHAVNGETLEDFAGRIINETNRVATIVQNLLSFARDEKERHSPAYIPDLIESTLSLIRAVFRKDQINLVVEIEEDLPKVKCRSQQIQQVLMNLLTNARDSLNLKYEPGDPNKKLFIHCAKHIIDDRKMVRITIEDFGLGIPEDIHDRIFDPFYTTKQRSVGTGLGLSISHGIIKEHRGELGFESKEGEFTRFYIDLPIQNGWTIPGDGIVEDQ